MRQTEDRDLRVDLSGRRRESLLLLLIAVLLALGVNILSSLVIDVFAPRYRYLLWLMSFAAITLALLLVYAVILSRRERVIEQAQLVLPFDFDSKRFVVFPHSIATNLIAQYFGELSDARTDELVSARYQRRGMHMSRIPDEFHEFLEDAVQALLLKAFLGESYPEAAAHEFDALPETMKRNACLSRQNHGQVYFFLPQWAKLATFGSLERSLRITSPMGSVEITWNMDHGIYRAESKPFLAVLDVKSSHVRDYVVNVNMVYEFRFLRLHSRRLDDFAKWILHMRTALLALDWSRTREIMPSIMLAQVVRNLAESNLRGGDA